jgi:cholesterol oxidase
VSPALLGVPLVGCGSDGDSGSGNGDDRGVAIVGSGYGAAVTALRLTEAGIPVTLFEKGRLWDTPGEDGKIFCHSMNPDGRAMWFKDETEAVIKSFLGAPATLPVPRQAGIIDVLGPETMRASVGRGFGGGSLVNLAVYVEPIREILGRTLPDVDLDEMYDVYYPRAKAGLQASQVPADLIDADVYLYSRTGIAHAEAVGIEPERVTSGFDYDYLRREIEGEVPASASIGEGGFGNNYGKLSLDKTYFAEAMGTGLLTVHALTEVTRLTAADGGYVLHTREIDIDGNVLDEREVPCSSLFLCAGTFGSTELLLRARERGDLPDLNERIGTGWGPNSDIFVARDNTDEYPTGPVQCTLPSSSFHTRDHEGKHVFSMIIPFGVGFEANLSFNIVMTESEEEGHFVYDGDDDSVSLVWEAGQNDAAVESARAVFDPINDATGSTYNDTLFGGPTLGDSHTYHPLGGVPLGRATDSYGRIPDHPGLYVLDGALIPVGVGANPSLTITALAERCIDRILAEDFG